MPIAPQSYLMFKNFSKFNKISRNIFRIRKKFLYLHSEMCGDVHNFIINNLIIKQKWL